MRSVLAIAFVLALSACSGTGSASEVTFGPPITTTSVPTTQPPVTTSLVPSTTTSSTSTTTTAQLPIDQNVDLLVDGEARTYHLYVPATAKQPAALVVDFHGLAGTAAQQDGLSGMRAKADREGFVVAQPEGRGALQYWESAAKGVAVTGDVEFARSVVADAMERAAIDADRVYATGMSNGGGMANRLACEAADVFAAVAPVAGAYTQDEQCDSQRPVPVLAFHGSLDPVVPISGLGRLLPSIFDYIGRWAERNACEGDAETRAVADDVTVYEWSGCSADVVLYVVTGGAHGWPGTSRLDGRLVTTDSISATDLMWEFFQAHPKS